MTAEMPAIMAELAEEIAEPGAAEEIAEAVEDSKAADRLDAPPARKDSP
jgi:hypothetical protein